MANWKVVVIDNYTQCEEAVKMMRKDCKENPILGLDCEWVSDSKVALLQLCTHKGYCALIRLCAISSVPQSLRELLQDCNVVKVGVGVLLDAQRLRNSKLSTVSTLDLRYVAERTGGAKSKSLATMYKEVVGGTLDKSLDLSKSNWEAEDLTQSQINYAAGDVIAGMKIYMALAQSVSNVKVFEQYYNKEYVP